MLAELIKLQTSDGLSHFGAFYPAEKNPQPLAAVMVHGMTGSFVGEIEGSVPQMLAQAGFATVVANNRGHGILGAATEPFAGCIPDIQAALDFAQARGFKRIALFGHSKGGTKVAYYMTQTADPRVAGLGVLSPAGATNNVPTFFAPQFGARNPEAWIKRAKRQAKQGKAETIYASNKWPFLMSAGMIAEHTNITGDNVLENLPKISVPVLAACGSQELDWCIVAKLLREPPAGMMVEVVEGADHVYTGREVQLADLMIRWMKTLV
jgi:alpha-beta hydrolase superfamily lysophospholipase